MPKPLILRLVYFHKLTHTDVTSTWIKAKITTAKSHKNNWKKYVTLFQPLRNVLLSFHWLPPAVMNTIHLEWFSFILTFYAGRTVCSELFCGLFPSLLHCEILSHMPERSSFSLLYSISLCICLKLCTHSFGSLCFPV